MDLIRPCLLVAAVLAAGSSLLAGETGTISIVPRPLHVERKEGSFALTGTVRIFPGETCGGVAEYLADKVERYTGLVLEQVSRPPEWGRVIRLVTEAGEADLGPEGYVLAVEPGGVTIRAQKSAGVFYGVQSLLQLVPLEAPWALPCVAIRDEPRFSWRGLHLDVSRHFFGTGFIKKYIDLLAMHKMNVFHWHIVDGQGWRLEIEKYPKLTEIGAWRSGEDGKNWNYRTYRFPLDGNHEGLYGGYCTRDGTEPTRASTPYVKPFSVTRTATVKVRGFLPSGRATRVLEGVFEKAAFRDPAKIDPEALRPGLRCVWYEGAFETVEKLADAKPRKESVEPAIAIPKGAPADRFGLAFEGYVCIPRDGIYAFSCASDDGSRLYVGDTLVVENDGLHGTVERAGQAALRAGLHPVRVLFFEAGGAEALELTWQGPGISKGPIPAGALFHER